MHHPGKGTFKTQCRKIRDLAVPWVGLGVEYGRIWIEYLSNILEYYRNRDETKEYEEDLYTVKNLIYNNIYKF